MPISLLVDHSFQSVSLKIGPTWLKLPQVCTHLLVLGVCARARVRMCMCVCSLMHALLSEHACVPPPTEHFKSSLLPTIVCCSHREHRPMKGIEPRELVTSRERRSKMALNVWENCRTPGKVPCGCVPDRAILCS